MAKEEEKISTVFIPCIEAAVQEFVARWQDRDESDNFRQQYDAELVKDELRPIVFEEVRGGLMTDGMWHPSCLRRYGGTDDGMCHPLLAPPLTATNCH